MNTVIDQLEKLHIFKGTPREDLELLIQLCQVRYFKPGQVIFSQGSKADCAMILVSGLLSASIHTGQANRHLGDVHSGELFGEQGLFHTGGVRNAQILAKKDSVCILIYSQMMRDTSSNKAVVSLEKHLIATMGRRIRNTNLAIQKAWKEEQQDVDTKKELSQKEPISTQNGLLGKLKNIFGGK
jgi:CRP-like cAMP-binding protein